MCEKFIKLTKEEEMNITIIIPALNPDRSLIDYVKELKNAGLDNLLIIDDGSEEEKKEIFTILEKELSCVVLRHAMNMGKGRALKDAFNYCLTNSWGEGVITVDSDGQHTVKDVVRMKEALEAHPDALILGARVFEGGNVPPKSSFGNKLTRKIMKFLYGGNITDTQTGLRALSFGVLPEYLTLFGERFEYETGMLIETLRKKIPIHEVKIETIYFEENKGTHFRPIADSWAIYKLIFGTFFKYSLSSFSSSLIDLGMFELLILILKGTSTVTKVWGATVGARIISSLYNYYVNKTIVFRENGESKNTFVKYYALCMCQMCVSAFGVYVLYQWLRLPEMLTKIIVDAVLFVLSFQIQRKWIFGGKN